MKPIYDFVNVHLIPKIEEFMDEAGKTPIRAQCMIILTHLKKIEPNKNFDEMKAAFRAMKELGASSKNLVNKFDANFYAKLDEAIRGEVRANAGIFSAIIPQSKIINGIKNALGDQGAQGDNYGALMKDILNRSLSNHEQ